MKEMFFESLIKREIDHFLSEDSLDDNLIYLKTLPNEIVECCLKFKSDLIVAGIPYFKSIFCALGATSKTLSTLDEFEGKKVATGTSVKFKMPFNVALSGERLALNLLSHASKIATHTASFVEKAAKHDVAILDTRKTTPGLRTLEKYAVVIGGGYNHRMSQTDVWMIKDNHKKIFGGVKESVTFFKKQKSFYKPIILEVHTKEELIEGLECGVNHFLLDNFSPSEIKELVNIKKSGVTYEVSGGVNLINLESYLIDGVDAISSGSLIAAAPPVDISLKMEK